MTPPRTTRPAPSRRAPSRLPSRPPSPPSPRPLLRRALAPARVAAVLAALAIAAPPAPAAAQGSSGPPTKAAREEATSRFKKGIELFEDGDYQAALIEFRRAHDLVPTYGVLYNIGQVQYQLQDYAGALATLERYLAEGGRQIAAARRSDVEQDIQKLKGRISQIELVVNVPDAEVAVDDVPAGKGPFTKPITVSAGRRKITVSRDGYATQSRTVDLASNDTTQLTFELVERAGQATPSSDASKQPPPSEGGDASETPAATPPPPAGGGPEDGGGSPAPLWIGWAATGAFAAGAVVFGALALGASSDLQDVRAQDGVSTGDLSDAAGKTTTLAIVTDVFAGAALVAGGVSLYFTLTRPSPPADAARQRSIRLGVAPTGVRVLGTF